MIDCICLQPAMQLLNTATRPCTGLQLCCSSSVVQKLTFSLINRPSCCVIAGDKQAWALTLQLLVLFQTSKFEAKKLFQGHPDVRAEQCCCLGRLIALAVAPGRLALWYSQHFRLRCFVKKCLQAAVLDAGCVAYPVILQVKIDLILRNQSLCAWCMRRDNHEEQP